LIHSPSFSSSIDGATNLWSEPRLLTLNREPDKSLGISIVGGKLDISMSSNTSNISSPTASDCDPLTKGLTSPTISGTKTNLPLSGSASSSSSGSHFINGIFVKHVLDKSPAAVGSGKDGIKIGDRILAVNDVDLTYSSHENAVEVIKNAKSPITFKIQSLLSKTTPPSTEPPQSTVNTIPSKVNKAKRDSIQIDDDDIDEYLSRPDLVETNKLILNNEVNKYNYTINTIKDKYSDLIDYEEGEEGEEEEDRPDSDSPTNNHENEIKEQTPKKRKKNHLYIFKLRRNEPTESLGLSLSGNVNLNKTSVFVCGIYDNSIAHKHGLIQVGDQILEINGQSLYGRAHSNVTPLIKNIKDLDVYLVVLRNYDNINQMCLLKRNSSSVKSNSTIDSLINSEKVLSPNLGSPIISQAPSITTADTTESSNTSNHVKFQTPLISYAVSASSKSSLPTDSASTTPGGGGGGKITKIIKLNKGPNGFGIAISEDRHNRLIVRGLNPNGVAFHDGQIHIGDEIIEVNKIKVNTMKYDDVMHLLYVTSEPVEFTVLRNENNNETAAKNILSHSDKKEKKAVTSPLLGSGAINALVVSNSSSGGGSSSISPTIGNKNDPKTNKIRIGEEILIDIERGKLGLGLSIVGGSDTQLPGIIIHDIYENGAAFRDKRLAIGDQILKVNNIDLTNSTHEFALNTLRQTTDIVRLLIHRGYYVSTQSTGGISQRLTSSTPMSMSSSTSSMSSYGMTVINMEDERLFNIIQVDLTKKFGKGLGFSIIGRRDGSGVFISHIVSNIFCLFIF
jgi:multiple PDZ domain protein